VVSPGLCIESFLIMLDHFRVAVAPFTTRHLQRWHAFAIRAWFWLAVQTDHLEEKRRYLNAILELDPENEPATLALPLFNQRRPTSLATALGTSSTRLVRVTLPNRPCCHSA
jgi:hypothetical protein